MLELYFLSLGQELTKVSLEVIDFLPALVLSIATVLVGFIFGATLGRAVHHTFDLLKIDKFWNSLGILNLSKITGKDLSLGNIFGGLIKWTIIIAFFLVATNILGLKYISIFLFQVMNYLPNVFVAGIILVITSSLASFTENIIDGSVKSIGLKTGFAGTIAKYAIIFTGILAALSQLSILDIFAHTLFIGIVSAVSLAFGLAFGLGGKDVAARALERFEADFTKK